MRASLETIKDCKNLVGCEIGVSWGENARLILVNLDISKLYLVDPLWKNAKELAQTKQYIHEYLDKITWIDKRSEDVTTEDIPHDSLDFVYIDGDHRYEPVMKDLELYWPRVKKGGLFAGHDFYNAGVKKAVLEFTDGMEFNTDSVDWWVYK